jgi:HTH-type transcriptional regulator / antitoxin HigA
MASLNISPEYTAILKKYPPKVIRSEIENEIYTDILYGLDRRSKKLTRAENELTDL